MSHKRVDRTERRTLDVVLVNETVAIGYPLLAVVADTSLSEVAFLTPNGIAHMEPERRSPCAYGCVVEYICTLLAHFVFYAYDSLAILNTGIGEVRTNSRELRTDTIELEETEVVLLDYVL